MTKDRSNNLFSSCKSFGALHVKVHLGRKAMPNRPSIYASFPHQPGDSGTIFAISPEEINTTGCLTTSTYFISQIPKLSKREIICTISGPAEQRHDPLLSGCESIALYSVLSYRRWSCGYHGFSMNEEGTRDGYDWATGKKGMRFIREDWQAVFVRYACLAKFPLAKNIQHWL